MYKDRGKEEQGKKGNSEEEMYRILREVDYVPTNISDRKRQGKIVIFEDNDAVIKITVKDRSPNMRHATRTHRFNLD